MRFLSNNFVLLFVLFLICLSGSRAEAQYGGGSGEPNDPYQIATAEHLLSIGSDPNLLNKHFALVADIDLDPNLPGGTIFTKALIASDPDYPFRETGATFTGSFDGNGYAIRNLHIDGPTDYYLGVFGFVGPGGLVKNLRVENIAISSQRSSVGGLAGANWGVITNCHVTGHVCGRSSVGGLVGRNGSYEAPRSGDDAPSDANTPPDESLEGTILDCSADVNVAGIGMGGGGSKGTGGLVGVNSGGIIRCCWSSGSATGEDWVGGLIGMNRKGQVNNSYSDSSVQGDGDVGGLIGRNYDGIMLCYSVGTVTGEKRVGGLIGNDNGSTYLCYWDVQTSGFGSSEGGRGKTTEQMKNTQTFRGWGYEAQWTIDEGNDYPRLAWEQLPGALIVDLPCEYSGGTGDASNPYQIRTAEQFSAIGYCWPDFDKHFVLMDNIDLNDVDPNAMVPIGFPGIAFSGTYDGNNLTISNFKCWSSGENYIGMFGYVGKQGVIKNAILSSADIRGLENVGALAGSSEGTIINCSVSSHVNGYRFVGGLVGSIGPNATISSCSSDSDVTGHLSVGGLAGYNLDGSISMCDSTAVVTSSLESAGGLVGMNLGDILYCYSHGHVSGDYNVGGLVGTNCVGIDLHSYIGDVSDSDSTASVDGNSDVGGLVGDNWAIVSRCYSSGEITGIEKTGGLIGNRHITDPCMAIAEDCYWDMDTSGQATSEGGIGKTTIEMKQRATFTDWDFVGVWGIGENQTYPFLRYHPAGDLNYDNCVDMLDLAILAENWLD